MTRIAAQLPADFQFRSADTPPTRAQKLEILRQAFANYSLVGHEHEIADVVGLQEVLDYLLSAIAAYRIGSDTIAGLDTPPANATLLIHVATDDIYFRPDFLGSEAAIGINPTSSFVITFYRNPTFTGTEITAGEIIGTLTFSTAGLVTFETTDNDRVQIDKGDVIAAKGPALDATAKAIAFTLYALVDYIANLLLYTGDENPDGLVTEGLSGDQGDGSIILSGDFKYVE